MTVAEGVVLCGPRLEALTPDQRSHLEELSTGSGIRVRLWGVVPSQRSKWERVGSGDLVLFARSNQYFAAGTVPYTFRYPRLAKALWAPRGPKQGGTAHRAL